MGADTGGSVSGCAEACWGASRSIVGVRADVWSGGGEVDSGCWRMGADTGSDFSAGTGFRREDGGVRLDTGDKGRDEVAVEGVQPFACGWVELFSTSLVGKVGVDGGADCDSTGRLGMALP